MSWGSVGQALKSGFESEKKTGAMRNANDPTGAGYGTPAQPPAPAAPLAASLPLQSGYVATPPGVQQPKPLSLTPDQSSPLASLLHAIWSRRT